MGLLIAQTEGNLADIKSYDFAIAGAEYNVAIGATRLGHNVTYITKLGNDPFGHHIQQELNNNNINSEYITFSSTNPTGFMLKGRTNVGDPDIFYFRKNSAASTLNITDINKICLKSYSHIHFTGITPALSSTAKEATIALMKKAHQEGLFISFDPNLRPQLWTTQDEMISTINELASYADLVLPGIAEGKILVGTDDAQSINTFYIKNGASICVTNVVVKGHMYLQKMVNLIWLKAIK